MRVVKNFVYLCSEGVRNDRRRTQYRRLWKRAFLMMRSITCLDNDIKRVKDELSDEHYWFGKVLMRARQHAMIDMSFNLGQTRLAKDLRKL